MMQFCTIDTHLRSQKNLQEIKIGFLWNKFNIEKVI